MSSLLRGVNKIFNCIVNSFLQNKHHHGPASNSSFFDGYNTSTVMSTNDKNGHKDKYSKVALVARQVEFGMSNIGSEDRSTRDGYKDHHKLVAFTEIENLCERFHLHQLVRDVAKQE